MLPLLEPKSTVWGTNSPETLLLFLGWRLASTGPRKEMGTSSRVPRLRLRQPLARAASLRGYSFFAMLLVMVSPAELLQMPRVVDHRRTPEC